MIIHTDSLRLVFVDEDRLTGGLFSAPECVKQYTIHIADLSLSHLELPIREFVEDHIVVVAFEA